MQCPPRRPSLTDTATFSCCRAGAPSWAAPCPPRGRIAGKRWCWRARRETRARLWRHRARRGGWSGCGARLVCTWAWGRVLWACQSSLGVGAATKHSADDIAAVETWPLLLGPAVLVAAGRLAVVQALGELSASDVSCDELFAARSLPPTLLHAFASESSILTACKRSTRFRQKCRPRTPPMTAATRTIPTIAAEVTVVVLIVGAAVVLEEQEVCMYRIWAEGRTAVFGRLA
ncbi:hypothetical protein IWX49DRAFT_225457 [Phyllosticta citricarpa]|uniref:Uncharacterized protein n=1 Tax=Phyllosticta citricarpa TaxID=55181 RepID=A0ABR1MGU4_9PEZI